jgi:tetratricopeptide (TPR) repeat protein
LSRQPDSEQAAETRVRMANVFLSRGEFEKALPYAEAAAEKKSEAGMGCLIRCYQGLGDEQQEGVWHERMVDRHPSGENARERYLWSRRTGLGDAKALADEATRRLGAGSGFLRAFSRARLRQGSAQVRMGQADSQAQNAQAYSQARSGTFFWLAGRPDEAVEFYQAAAELSEDLALAAFCHSCCALIAEERGDQAGRDAALAAVAALRGPETDHYRRFASLLGKGISDKKIDPEEAEGIAASAPAADQGAMNFLLGYAMLLVGRTREAVPFLGAGSMSRTLASATLRDRGLVPGKIKNPDKQESE